MRTRWFCVLVLCAVLCALSPVSADTLPQVSEVYDTLENQVLLTGTAEKGDDITFSVYTYNEKDKTTLLYQGEDEVGDSGVYQLTIPLPVLGRQYVRVRVGDQETTYAYNRFRKQLASDLEDYYLNVYQMMIEEDE